MERTESSLAQRRRSFTLAANGLAARPLASAQAPPVPQLVPGYEQASPARSGKAPRLDGDDDGDALAFAVSDGWDGQFDAVAAGHASMFNALLAAAMALPPHPPTRAPGLEQPATVVEQLMSFGWDKNAVGPEKLTLLGAVCRRAATEVAQAVGAARYLLSAPICCNPNPAAAGPVGMRVHSPLMLAVASGSTELVGLLLAHDADVEAVADGATPVYLAAKRNSVEAARLILAKARAGGTRGCSLDDVVIGQTSQCGRANGKCHCGIACVNIKADTDNLNPLMLAVRHGNADLVRLLLEHDADTEVCGPGKAARSDTAACGPASGGPLARALARARPPSPSPSPSVPCLLAPSLPLSCHLSRHLSRSCSPPSPPHACAESFFGHGRGARRVVLFAPLSSNGPRL